MAISGKELKPIKLSLACKSGVLNRIIPLLCPDIEDHTDSQKINICDGDPYLNAAKEE